MHKRPHPHHHVRRLAKLHSTTSKCCVPHVTTLALFVSRRNGDLTERERLRDQIWELVFSGSSFPDLQEVFLNTFMHGEEDMPRTLSESLQMAPRMFSHRFNKYSGLTDSTPFYGLLGVKKIILDNNSFLTPYVLNSLFNSSIIPKRLTHLEITNCPRLHAVNDLEALTTLLSRGLQLLKHLKLHLLPYNGILDLHGSYNAAIDEHPEHHLCNIVRELGQNIKTLDLALPHACNRMLIPIKQKNGEAQPELPDLPQIAQEPFDTLQTRLIAEGYRYRRLITYDEICREAHTWDEMINLATRQEGNIIWEILGKVEEKAAWCVGGYAPVYATWEEAVSRPVFDAESPLPGTVIRGRRRGDQNAVLGGDVVVV